MSFFKYDEQNKREWFEVELFPGTLFSRATIQDYARGMGMEPKQWVDEGIAFWMGWCDKQGAHGHQEDIPTPPPRVPAWRVRLAERFYRIADRLSSVEDS